MSADKKRASYKRIRLFIDIAMSFMLPMLMAYSLIGEMLHEIIGTLMLVLFVLHHAMNRKWYLAILTIKKSKLGFESDDQIEVIDLRAKQDEVPELIKNENI